MTVTRPEQPTPAYVPPHDLLRDKVVAVTAGAGAGIGAVALIMWLFGGFITKGGLPQN